MSPEPTRRWLLAVAAGTPLLLAGCRGIQALGPLPMPSADVVTLDRAISAEERMVASYRAAQPVLTGHPRAAAVIAALLAEHHAHLDQLRSRLILPPRLASAGAGPGSGNGNGGTQVAGGPAQVMTSLKVAEAAAAARLTTELAAVPAALAQLMASISASEAAHVVVLSQVGLA